MDTVLANSQSSADRPVTQYLDVLELIGGEAAHMEMVTVL
jgi:hypothetical protein